MLEEKIDLLITAVEKFTNAVNGQGQIPLQMPVSEPEPEPTPKAKGKKITLKTKGSGIVEEAEVITSEHTEFPGSFDTLKDKIIAVASELDDGRDRVKAIFKKLKVDTTADLKPEQWAECYELLAKEK